MAEFSFQIFDLWDVYRAVRFSILSLRKVTLKIAAFVTWSGCAQQRVNFRPKSQAKHELNCHV